MLNKQESMVTKLLFDDTVIVEVSADSEGALMYVSKLDDEDHQVRSVCLDEDEIDVLIEVLTFYKKRLHKKRAISG